MKNKESNFPISSQDFPDALSRLRQRLRQRLQELDSLAWTLGDAGPMIMGSYYQVYKTCTQNNCRCQRGEKHGPFPALSWSAAGKRRMVMVKEADASAVEQKARAYRNYRKGLVKVRMVIKDIEEILEQIRSLLVEEYPKR
jgi:hypothetical protein